MNSFRLHFILLLLITLVSFLSIGCSSPFSGLLRFDDDETTISAPGIGALGSIIGKITASGSIKLSLLSHQIRSQVASGNTGIPNVQVWLQDYPNISTTTNASGNYILENVPLGVEHRVVAKFTMGAGINNRLYKVRSHAVKVLEKVAIQLEINLELKTANNTVSGILRDPDGSPLPNTEIEIWGEKFVTGSNGYFLSPGLPDTENVDVIKVKGADGTVRPITVVFSPTGTSFVDLTLQKPGDTNISPRILLLREFPDKNVSLGESITLWACFYDLDGELEDLQLTWEKNSGKIASASISLPATIKEEFDKFTAGVKASKITFKAITFTAPSSEGYSAITVSCSDKKGLSAKCNLKLPVSASLKPLPLPVNQSPVPAISTLASFSVKIGKALPLSVSANDPDGNIGLTYFWSSSPAGGTFSNTALPVVTWSAPNASGTYSISCAVSDGQATKTITRQVTVFSDTIVTSPGKISGYVKDTDTAQPISGALVVISGTDRYAISDANGRFEFTGLDAGTYTLIATKNGYQIKTFTDIKVFAS